MTNTHNTKIALSFDDGALDGYTNIFPLLKKYNLPATFNIVTGYLDQNTCGVEKPFPILTWQMAREMSSSSLVEIANHSSNHTNDWDAITAGRKVLLSKLNMPTDKMMGFASPESKLPIDNLLYREERFINFGFSYVRTGMRVRSHKATRIVARKLSRVIHLGWIYKFAYRDTLLNADDDYFLYSVPIMRDTTINQLIALIEYARAIDKNIVLLLHRIKKRDEAGYHDNWSWDYSKFECLLKYLYNEQLRGHIKVVKTQDIIDRHYNNGVLPK